MNNATTAALSISPTAGVAAAFFVQIGILAVWMAFAALGQLLSLWRWRQRL